MPAVPRVPFLVALAWLAFSPAHAIAPLVGTYEGRMTCRTGDDGTVRKLKQDVRLSVAPAESALRGADDDLFLFFAEGAAAAGAIHAIVVASAADPARARIGGDSCLLTFGGLEGLALQADAVVKAESGKASIKGTFIEIDAPTGRIGTCTFTVRRVSEVPLEIPGCL